MIFRLGRLIAQKGPGLILPDPDRRPDGPGRPADGDAERPAAGGDHPRQRHGPRQRGRLLPGDRPEQGGHRGRELPPRHVADRADDAALGARQGRARRAAVGARAAQRRAPADHRRADRALGREGHDGRDQGRRAPADMQRAMARQAEAERERRAKIIAAEGEFQAAEKLAQAAEIISRNPTTLQLRYLQTLLELGVNRTRRSSSRCRSTCCEPFTASSRDEPAATGRTARRLTLEQSGRLPRSGSTSSPGCAAILAPGPGRAPGRFRVRACPRHAPGARETCPFCEGREDRTPPEVWADRPGGGEPDNAGLDRPRGPEPVPGAGRRGAGSRRRRRRRRDGAGELGRPAAPVDAGRRARPLRVASRRTARTR